MNGVVTALGVNVGSAGAFVVNGGALGSPSSVGTMPAFTLGGTVSGGGNQINNVIIGTTTPLAGAFTTVTASTPIGTASGGTGLGGATPFTSGGVVYASSSSVLATGSALTFDGTTLTTPRLALGGITFPAAGGTGTLFTRTPDNNTYLQTGSGNNVLLLDNSQNTMYNVSPTLHDFLISNSGAMRLTSTGLGIGTTSPAVKLDVVGAISATGTLSGGTSGTAYSFSGSAPATSLTLDASGNLGIGTSSPAQTLHVKTSTSATPITLGVLSNATSLPALSFNGAYASTTMAGIYGNGAAASNLYYEVPSGQNHYFGIADSTKMTLDSAGNLGLGVTPSAWLSTVKALQVNSAALYSAGNELYLSANEFTNSSAANIYKNTGFATLYAQNSGQHRWYTSGTLAGTQGNPISFTQAMTLDEGGKLLLGTTSSPSQQAAIYRTSATTSNGALLLDGNGNYAGIQFAQSGNLRGSLSTDAVSLYMTHESNIVFNTGGSSNVGGSERARIDSSGNLLVGATATSAYFDAKANFYSPATYSAHAGRQGGAANAAVQVLWHEATSGDNLFVSFLTETSPTYRGSISYNRAGGLVAYNVTSDYRAKDISGPVTNSGALIDSVPVYMGKMKDATQERPMFIAHEVPAYAHTGEKDAVDKDGKPVYQQMDASALIPVMWAELQSLRARVAQLESKP